MVEFRIFLFMCSLLAADVTCSSFQNIDPSAQIDKTAILGSFINIEKDVIIKAKAEVRSFSTISSGTSVAEQSIIGEYCKVGQRCSILDKVTIGDYAKIGNDNVIKANAEVKNFATTLSGTTVAENSFIGEYCNVGERCSIQNNVNIGNHAKIGNDNVIGVDSVLYNYVTVKNNVTFGNRIKSLGYATIWDKSEIKDDSILDQYSVINNNGKIQQMAYIGKYSSIGEDSIVNELAVVHRYAKVEKGSTVKEREVVIRTPSSYELYQAAQKAEHISAAEVEIAAKNTGSISPEFNQLLNGLIDAELETLKTNCNTTNTPTKLQSLASIRSLYLIRVHGLDRFKEYEHKIHNRLDNSLLKKLFQELHLCGVSEINVLEADVKKKFIQLLTIEQDEERQYRVKNDNFCAMFAQIQKEERQITCVASSAIWISINQSNVATNNFSVLTILIASILVFWKFQAV